MRNQIFSLIPVLASTLLASGCATLQEQEAAILSGQASCVFGGVTEKSVLYCGYKNFGVEGLLAAANALALQQVPERGVFADGNCQEHVDLVEAKLAAHPQFRFDRLYSCPERRGAGDECHVSALVTAPDGRQYVLDNGAVVSDARGFKGTARLEDYLVALDGASYSVNDISLVGLTQVGHR